MTIFVVKTRLITSLKLHPVFKTGKKKIELNKKKVCYGSKDMVWCLSFVYARDKIL